MLVAVGLGNPGQKYSKNRHNTGYIIVDNYAKTHQVAFNFEAKFKGELGKDDSTIFLKPQTFMNLSGESVSAVLNFYKITSDKLMVVHDDVDLDFGRVKLQRGGSSAGHHGIENIIQNIGTDDFFRLRVGVGRPGNVDMDVTDWVLSDFSSDELLSLDEIKLEEFLMKIKNSS